jgi:hypothetical protein
LADFPSAGTLFKRIARFPAPGPEGLSAGNAPKLSIAIIPKKAQTKDMRWLDSIRRAAGQGLDAANVLTVKLKAFSRARRKTVLICLAVCAVLLALGVTAILTGLRKDIAAESGQVLREAFDPHPVPPEDFFLPGEPDFLPETIPERERRKSWTVEDALPFWTDPLDEGTAEYTDLMSSVIDDLMERIP